MNSKQGPRGAGMRTTVNAVSRRHGGGSDFDKRKEAAA